MPLQTGVFPLKVILTDPTTQTKGTVQFTVTVKCTKQITLLDNPLAPLSYNVGEEPINTVRLALPTYWPFPADCQFGPLTYRLEYLDAPGAPFPAFISQVPMVDIVVSTQAMDHLGQNNFRLVATDTYSGIVNNEVTQEVVLYCQVAKLTAVFNAFEKLIVYTPVFEGLYSQQIPDYKTFPERCVEPYKTEVVPITLTALPEWIWLSYDKKQLNIASNDANLNGEYQFKIVATVEKYSVLNEELTFWVKFDCKIKKITAGKYMTDYKYFIDPNLTVQVFLPMPEFYGNPSYCPQVFELSLSISNSKLAEARFAVIEEAKNQIKLSTSNLDFLGTYQISVDAYDARYGQTGRVQFSVLLDCKVKRVIHTETSDTVSRINYTIGDPKIKFKLPDYETIPRGCNKRLDFTIQSMEQKANGGQGEIPSFIRLDSVAHEIVLEDTNMHIGVKNFTFFILAKEPLSGEIDSNPYTFVVQTKITNTAPFFFPGLTTVVITVMDLLNGDYIIHLPKVVDQENNKISQFNLKLGETTAFTTFQPTSKILKIDSKQAFAAEAKIYTIQITLEDEFGAKSINNLIIELTPDRQDTNTKSEMLTDGGIVLNVTRYDYVDPADVFDLFRHFERDEQEAIATQDFDSHHGFMAAQISKVAFDGTFQVNWSDRIFPVRKLSVIQKNAVQVNIIWLNDSILLQQEPKPNYEVRILDVTEEFISFQLLFDDPALISRGQLPDVVEVNFLNADFFVRQTDFARLGPASRIFIAQIPRLLEFASAKQELESVNKVIETSHTASKIVLGSIAAGSITGVSGATFFGCFNTIQLITMQAYTNSEMPSNAANLFKSIDEFLRGGVMNPGKYLQKKLGGQGVSLPVLKRDLATHVSQNANQKLQQMVSDQYIPKSPFVEAGFFFAIIPLCLVASAILAILVSICSYRRTRFGLCIVTYFVAPLQNVFTFSLLIYAQQFGYVYFVLSGVQQKVFQKSLVEYGVRDALLNTTISYLVFAFVVMYPVVVCFFLFSYQKLGQQDTTVNSRFGALYSGIDKSNGWNSQYVTLFLLRRFAIGVSIAFLHDWYFTQLLVLQVTSMVVLTVCVSLRPYESKLKNAVEFANESLVICTIYLMHGFSFFILDTRLRFKLGWAYIGIVAIVFLINVVAVIQGVSLFLFRSLKYSRAKERLKSLIQKVRSACTRQTGKSAKATRRKRTARNENSVVPLDSVDDLLPQVPLATGNQKSIGGLSIIEECQEEDSYLKAVNPASRRGKPHQKLSSCEIPEQQTAFDIDTRSKDITESRASIESSISQKVYVPVQPSACQLHTLGDMIKKSELTARSLQEEKVKIVVENAEDPVEFPEMKDLFQKSRASARSPDSRQQKSDFFNPETNRKQSETESQGPAKPNSETASQIVDQFLLHETKKQDLKSKNTPKFNHSARFSPSSSEDDSIFKSSNGSISLSTLSNMKNEEHQPKQINVEGASDCSLRESPRSPREIKQQATTTANKPKLDDEIKPTNDAVNQKPVMLTVNSLDAGPEQKERSLMKQQQLNSALKRIQQFNEPIELPENQHLPKVIPTLKLSQKTLKQTQGNSGPYNLEEIQSQAKSKIPETVSWGYFGGEARKIDDGAVHMSFIHPSEVQESSVNHSAGKSIGSNQFGGSIKGDQNFVPVSVRNLKKDESKRAAKDIVKQLRKTSELTNSGNHAEAQAKSNKAKMTRNQSIEMDQNSKVAAGSIAKVAVVGMPALEEEAKIQIRLQANKFDHFEAKSTSPQSVPKKSILRMKTQEEAQINSAEYAKQDMYWENNHALSPVSKDKRSSVWFADSDSHNSRDLRQDEALRARDTSEVQRPTCNIASTTTLEQNLTPIVSPPLRKDKPGKQSKLGHVDDLAGILEVVSEQEETYSPPLKSPQRETEDEKILFPSPPRGSASKLKSQVAQPFMIAVQKLDKTLQKVDDLKSELQKQQNNLRDDTPDSKIALPPKLTKKVISVPNANAGRHSEWLPDLDEEEDYPKTMINKDAVFLKHNFVHQEPDVPQNPWDATDSPKQIIPLVPESCVDQPDALIAIPDNTPITPLNVKDNNRCISTEKHQFSQWNEKLGFSPYVQNDADAWSPKVESNQPESRLNTRLIQRNQSMQNVPNFGIEQNTVLKQNLIKPSKIVNTGLDLDAIQEKDEMVSNLLTVEWGQSCAPKAMSQKQSDNYLPTFYAQLIDNEMQPHEFNHLDKDREYQLHSSKPAQNEQFATKPAQPVETNISFKPKEPQKSTFDINDPQGDEKAVEAPNQSTKQQTDPSQEKEESKTVPLRQIKPFNKKKESTKWFEVGDDLDGSRPQQAQQVQPVEMRQVGKISLPMQFTKNLSEAIRQSKVKEELDLFQEKMTPSTTQGSQVAPMTLGCRSPGTSARASAS